MHFYKLALLLPFVLLLCSAQSTYYVTPTPDTPCPGEPCLSFVEHTRQGGGHLDNATLVFLPGNHTIDSSIGIGNLASLTLLGDPSSLPNITSRIVCSQPASIVFQCIENLFISALDIVSCGSEDNAYMYGYGFGSDYGSGGAENSEFDFQGAAVVAKSVQHLTISKCLFRNNTNDIRGALDVGYGGGVYIKDSNANFTGNHFNNNQAQEGGGIYIENSVANFSENEFMNNQAAWGGGVAVYTNSTGYFTENIFINNTARLGGGGIDIYDNSKANFLNNTLVQNTAAEDGGAVYDEFGSSVEFNGNTFSDNSAMNGGGVAIQYTSTANFTGNSFTNNSINGTWEVEIDTTSTATFINNNFTGYAIYGSTNNTSSIHYVRPSPDTRCNSPCLTLSEYLRLSDQYFTLNTTLIFLHGDHSLEDKLLVRDLSVLTLIGGTTADGNSSTAKIICNSTMAFFYFQNISKVNISKVSFVSCGNANFSAMNLLALFHTSFSNCTFQNSTGGALFVTQTDTLVLTNNSFTDNMSPTVGGGIQLLSVNDASFHSNSFTGNHAGSSGGAMFIANSTVHFSGKTTFKANSGQLFGGAIAIINSTMSCRGDTTFVDNTANSGGGVFAVQCRLNFEGKNIFIKNTASRDGGGLLLTSDSKYYLYPKTNISFTSNSAVQNGGAIKADVSNQLVYCHETSFLSTLNDCFFQLKSSTRLGITLYEDLYDFNVKMNFTNNSAGRGNDIYGGAVDNCGLQSVDTECCDFRSSGKVLNCTITGNCYMDPETLDVTSDPLRICICENNVINCDSSSMTRKVHPGGKFTVSVIALGQRDGNVSAVIQAYHTQHNLKFDSFQYSQNTNNMCTDIEYTVFSLAKLPTEENIILFAQGPCPRAGRSLEIRVKVMQCPHGFKLSNEEHKCICSTKLKNFTDNTCIIENGTILRPDGASFWVGYSSNNGLIFHPHCPFDFCISEETYVSVDNSSMQCNYNRNGTLCGKCLHGLSLVLGSSDCLKCSNERLALLTAFAFAGIALVFFLFLLKLTVAAGTINGLIFYANVVQVNSAVFFLPYSDLPKPARILTVFIAWLNLDLGIETCFYDGMDAYAKTWLQFLFPVYVWTLVGIIILFSHFSQKISSLLGTNPIAVLCTLFLLSYAKILRTIIEALSFATLEYPDRDKTVNVWRHDGNIRYYHDEHVPLFLVALFVLLFLFLPFSLLLFCGQWLQGMSNSRVFSWINRPTIKSILDAYHAPYARKHRYWTGLLLLTRSSLFVIFAFHALRSPDVNLICITTSALALITIGFVAEKIYANRYLGALEASFIINLGILAAATTSKFAEDHQPALTYTSVSIAFATFIGIVVYHFYLQLKDYKLLKMIATLAVAIFHQKKKSTLNAEDIDKELNTSTQSVVSLREPLLEDEL